MHTLIKVAAIAALSFSSLVFAKDEERDVRIERDGRYSIDDFILGGPELVGYLGELKETEGVTGIVLLRSEDTTPEQQHHLAQLAADAGIKAYAKRGGKMQELADHQE